MKTPSCLSLWICLFFRAAEVIFSNGSPNVRQMFFASFMTTWTKFLNCVDCVQPRCLPCPLLPTPDLLVVFPWYDLRSNSTFPCKRGGGKEPNSSLSIVPGFRQPQGTKILRIEAQTSKKVLFLKAINVTRKKAALTTNRCPYIFKAQHLAKFSSRLFFLPPKEKEENELPPHFLWEIGFPPPPLLIPTPYSFRIPYIPNIYDKKTPPSLDSADR